MEIFYAKMTEKIQIHPKNKVFVHIGIFWQSPVESSGHRKCCSSMLVESFNDIYLRNLLHSLDGNLLIQTHYNHNRKLKSSSKMFFF